jgi:hypothetical protein
MLPAWADRPFKFGVIGDLEVFPMLRITVEAAAQGVARAISFKESARRGEGA